MAPKIRRGGGAAILPAKSNASNSGGAGILPAKLNTSNRSHSPSKVSNVGSSRQDRSDGGRRTSFMSESSTEDLNDASANLEQGAHARARSRQPSPLSSRLPSPVGSPRQEIRTDSWRNGSPRQEIRTDSWRNGSPRQEIRTDSWRNGSSRQEIRTDTWKDSNPRQENQRESPRVEAADDKIYSTLHDIKQALEENIAGNFKELQDYISREIQTIITEIRISQVHSPLLAAGPHGASPGQIKTMGSRALSRQLFADAYDSTSARSEDAALSEIFQFGRRDRTRTPEELGKRLMDMGGAPEEMTRIRAAMEAMAATQRHFKDNFLHDAEVRNCREDMRKLNVNIQKAVDSQTSEIARQVTQVSQDINSLEKTLLDQMLMLRNQSQTFANRLDASKLSSPAFGGQILDISQSPSLELSQLQHVSEDSAQRLTRLETTSRALLDRVSVVFGLGSEGGRSNTIPSLQRGLSDFEKALHNHRLEMGRAMESLRANITDNSKMLAETLQVQMNSSHQSFLDDLLMHLARTY